MALAAVFCSPQFDFQSAYIQVNTQTVAAAQAIQAKINFIFLSALAYMQYAFGVANILANRCTLQYAMPREYLTVSSWNIVNWSDLPFCVQTNCEYYDECCFSTNVNGKKVQNVVPLVYQTSVGICMGMSLTFLAEYESLIGNQTTRLKAAANRLWAGGTLTSVKLHAIYHHLINLSKAILHNNSQTASQKHHIIVKKVADYVTLQVQEPLVIEGNSNNLTAQLMNMTAGNYLLYFRNHVVVFIKSNDWQAVFNPSEGLALLTNEEQQQIAWRNLLFFYGTSENNQIELVPVTSSPNYRACLK